MEIQCECGKFRAKLKKFPKNTPGRLACYCDDCQTYAHHLGRADLLDAAGGTEVIPIYPSEIEFISGEELLTCLRLSPNGLNRWYASCCKTPVANIRAGFPWAGIFHRVYNVKDAKFLERNLGPIKSAIQGQYARGTPPAGTARKLDLKGFLTVFPFLMKGFILKRARNSPFFKADGVTPIKPPKILSLEERNQIRQRLGFEKGTTAQPPA